jgi:hypothetical protein
MTVGARARLLWVTGRTMRRCSVWVAMCGGAMVWRMLRDDQPVWVQPEGPLLRSVSGPRVEEE